MPVCTFSLLTLPKESMLVLINASVLCFESESKVRLRMSYRVLAGWSVAEGLVSARAHLQRKK